MTQPMGERSAEMLFAEALLDLHERVSDLEMLVHLLVDGTDFAADEDDDQ